MYGFKGCCSKRVKIILSRQTKTKPVWAITKAYINIRAEPLSFNELIKLSAITSKKIWEV